MELNGRVALVTGAGVRLGRAMAIALGGEGMQVLVHYNRSEEEAVATCALVQEAGGVAVRVQEDLSAPGAAARLAAAAIEMFGGVDVLVNSASVFPPESLEETDEETWERTMAVNLRAPFFLVRHLAATLRERRGVVVNMGDLAGMHAWRGYAAHSVAKAGIHHLTRIAARALAPEARVVGIAPGAVLPPEDTPPEQMEALARQVALRRTGSPEDVVEALLYLLRADFVTGEVLVVDGGRLLRG